jgi:hypothetical protein
MLAYQITINGRHIATAGVQQGVVSAIANWLCLPAGDSKSSPEAWHAGFSVAATDEQTSENLKWLRYDVQLGDEISIKLVETETVDEPTERGPRAEKKSFP